MRNLAWADVREVHFGKNELLAMDTLQLRTSKESTSALQDGDRLGKIVLEQTGLRPTSPGAIWRT
jgi:hypothetical protein